MMKNFVVLFGIVAVLYIAMIAAGSCAAKPLSQVLHGPAPIIHEHNTYDNSRETHILSDNVVKIFSDMKLASDNKLNSDNPQTTTNNNHRSAEETDGGALVIFAMVVIGLVAVATSKR